MHEFQKFFFYQNKLAHLLLPLPMHFLKGLAQRSSGRRNRGGENRQAAGGAVQVGRQPPPPTGRLPGSAHGRPGPGVASHWPRSPRALKSTGLRSTAETTQASTQGAARELRAGQGRTEQPGPKTAGGDHQRPGESPGRPSQDQQALNKVQDAEA